MNLNATLLGQMITFLLFVLFTKRYVWPHLQKALADRQEKIAEGLAAAERGHHDLILAQKTSTEKIRAAKDEATRILEEAQRQAAMFVDNAKTDAQKEVLRLKLKGEADLEQSTLQAKEALRIQVAKMALVGAEKILGKNIDEAANKALLDDLVEEI